MSNKESQKLIKLAKKTRDTNSSKQEALARLVSAGIVDKTGKYSKHYPNLASFFKRK